MFVALVNLIDRIASPAFILFLRFLLRILFVFHTLIGNYCVPVPFKFGFIPAEVGCCVCGLDGAGA